MLKSGKYFMEKPPDCCVELVCFENSLIARLGMRLTASELSLNGLTKFQRITLLSALRHTAHTIACVFRG